MSEKGIFAQFYLEPVELSFKSREAGRPIFEDREFVKIVIAGDKHTEVCREVTDADRERFHEVYDRFLRGLKGRDQMVGTPLSVWPGLGASQARELEAIEIYTVEQLAEVSDHVKQRIGMGSNELVARARAYLETAKEAGAAERYAVENERLRGEVADLRTQLADLAARLEGLRTDEPRRGAGRPPKSAAPEIGERTFG